MESLYRYTKLNEYYIKRFGERVLKICINGHFTCPNRDGTLSNSGCIFCSEKGSGELIKFANQHIANQVTNFLNSYRGKRANKFIAYFRKAYIADACFFKISSYYYTSNDGRLDSILLNALSDMYIRIHQSKKSNKRLDKGKVMQMLISNKKRNKSESI